MRSISICCHPFVALRQKSFTNFRVRVFEKIAALMKYLPEIASVALTNSHVELVEELEPYRTIQQR